MNRREFLKKTYHTAFLAACCVPSPTRAVAEENDQLLQSPLAWLNEVYYQSAVKNVLAALNPKVFFGYFSVCADGKGFGFGNTYPSLDGHQLSHALLFLGKLEEVRANWDYVKRFQKRSGQLPIMIDAKQKGLYIHWVPGDPLRTLGAATYAHNAYAIYTHTLDKSWLKENIESINLSAQFLASLMTPEGRVGGAGYYTEMPTRIEWDGVTQAYAVDAFLKTANLNKSIDREEDSARWTELANRIRTNFQKEFWREDHCVEYIHPQRGPVDSHGLTDVDWAALAMDLLPSESGERLWRRLKNEDKFRYGGMPTGISTAPETYEAWETIPADRFPNQDLFHDRAAMGRVWYVESRARTRKKDIEGLLRGLKAVAEAGAPNGYLWQERYFPSADGLKPGGPMTYCEYPANLIRIVNQFVLGVEPGTDGILNIAPMVPEDWWKLGWKTSLRIGAGKLSLEGQSGFFSITWQDKVERKLLLKAPAGKAWKIAGNLIGRVTQTDNQTVSIHAPAGRLLEFRLEFV